MLNLYNYTENRPYWKYFRMDGVFMRKIFKTVYLPVFALVLFLLGGLLADRFELQDKLIRLHVVANSNSEIDQSNKLAVRDAVLEYLNHHLSEVTTAEQAKDFLNNKTDEIESVVNEALVQLNARYTGKVSLQKEEFDTRIYDTFTLPSGIYTALRVDLGEADGKNWWCVAFPSLCIPATSDGFQQAAIQAGMNDSLMDTVANNGEYTIRFFFLECIGRLENFLHSS